MITTKIYEDKSGDLVAVVIEDEQVSNYIPCPEIAVFDGEGFFEEARNGFLDAPLYEYDSLIGVTMEQAAERAETEYALIAQIGDTVTIYPQRMNSLNQEFFQDELGEEVWQDLLGRVSGDDGIELEL